MNLAYGSLEKLALRGLDGIVNLSKALASAVKADRSVLVKDFSGTVHDGVLHSDYENNVGRKLVGRTLDLKHAYCQLPLCPNHSKYSVIVVRDPDAARGLFFLQRA